METAKTEMLERLETERRRLVNNLALLETLASGTGQGDKILDEPGVVGDWSVKDVLAHLAEWEAMCVSWVAASRRGEEPQVPAPGVSWKNLDPLNQQIYEKYHNCSLDEAFGLFHANHTQFMDMAQGLSEAELQPGHFAWCPPGLMSWLGAFAAHDAWGKKHLRAWMKAKKLI